MSLGVKYIVGLITLFIVLCLWVPAGAQTFVHTDGRSFTCYAPHGVTGQMVPARGSNGYANGRAAWAKLDNSGYPIVIFDPNTIQATLSGWPEFITLFLYYHECGHLRRSSSSEHVANCDGLQQMAMDGELNQPMLNVLIQYHASIGRGAEFQNAVGCAF